MPRLKKLSTPKKAVEKPFLVMCADETTSYIFDAHETYDAAVKAAIQDHDDEGQTKVVLEIIGTTKSGDITFVEGAIPKH